MICWYQGLHLWMVPVILRFVQTNQSINILRLDASCYLGNHSFTG